MTEFTVVIYFCKQGKGGCLYISLAGISGQGLKDIIYL